MGRPKGSKNKPKVEKIDYQDYIDRLVQQDDLIRRQQKTIEDLEGQVKKESK